MSLSNRFTELHQEIAGWRHHLHANPELMYDVHETAAFIVEKLRAFGLDEVTANVGRTGVVGVIKGQKDTNGRVIGLRADMDALPIVEKTQKPYASKNPGVMHACGHDGHMAMLLGAAKYLAETRHFDGTVVVIFQPAEEGGGGGKAMVDDGLMERWSIDEVYGLHNFPGVDVGNFELRPGPMMAAFDHFDIVVEGKGGHVARPHHAIDPILIANQIYTALQGVVSRNIDPLKSAVLSVTVFKAGETFNVIPQSAHLQGTVRTLSPEIRDLIEERMTAIVQNHEQMHGAQIRLDYHRMYPVVVNTPENTDFAVAAASAVTGDHNVDSDRALSMGSEDFSFMLEARPGAFMFLGNGPTANLHHEEYDFNDEIIPYGCSYWVNLVSSRLS